MSNLRRKIMAYIVLVLGTAWQLSYFAFFAGDRRRLFLLALFLFDGIALLLLTFAASIQPEQDGIRVEQFGISHLSYADLLECVIVPFFPQTFVLVTTNRRFPLNILFCPLKLDIDLAGKVETVNLADFLRSHSPRLKSRASRKKWTA